MERIIGIDPGYAIMGWAVLDHSSNRFEVVDYGAITTDAGVPMPIRLKHLYSELVDIIEKYKPQEASIEELFFNNNAKTVIHVGEARGIAILACINAGLEIKEYTPLQIKQALVGYGRADKKQVQEMVKSILGLSKVPEPDDTADAVAAAICHGNSIAGRRFERLVSQIEDEKSDFTGKRGSAGRSAGAAKGSSKRGTKGSFKRGTKGSSKRGTKGSSVSDGLDIENGTWNGIKIRKGI